MKSLRLTFTLLTFCIFLSLNTYAGQRINGTEDAGKTERARLAFATILKSESDAQSFVSSLYLYRVNSPWEYETILTLAQHLIVLGFKQDEVLTLLRASGDAVLGVSTEAGDEEFANLVSIMYDLRNEPDDLYLNISRLERTGLPAYKILSEATGQPIKKIEKLTQENRLKADVSYRILCEGFEVHFGNLAQKIAKQRDK